MRCNKCGEEYKDNQAFCLKCGNPIHVVPDFNLIEAELASDVGALMDSENEEGGPREFDDARAMKTVNVSIEDIGMELKMVDVNRGRFSFEEDDLRLEEEEEYIQPKRQVSRSTVNEQRQKSSSVNRTVSNQNTTRNVNLNNSGVQSADRRSGSNGNAKAPNNKPGNSKKSIVKNVFIMLGCILAIAFVVVILKKVVFSDSLNDSNNFKEQYNIAREYYDNNDKTKSIEESKKAVKIAYSTAEVLKARKLLHDVYVHFEVLDTEYEENLLKIVELESANNKYNEALLDYYYTNKRFEEFNTFFSTLEGKGTTENMEKYLPAKPVANYEGGHYDSFLTIELSAAEGMSIFYTLDGKEPKYNDNAFEYVEPISLNTESETVILAYAKDANGIMSKTLEVEYVIENVEVSGPVVTPSSGVYKEYQMITVTVPEGSNVYYTTDGSEPTASSIPYTEPFDMPYGRSDLRFVSIDASGIASNITSVTYNLSLERTVKIADAQTLVKDKCIKEKELDEDAKDKDEVQYEFNYKDIVVIDNAEYYIIEVSAEDDSVEVEYYAVNTNTATVVLATSTEEGYTIPEDTE